MEISAMGLTRQQILDAIDIASKGDTIIIPHWPSDWIDKFLSLKFKRAKRGKPCKTN